MYFVCGLLMSTAEVLLAVLATGPAHGYEVKRDHDGWFPDARPLAYGQVYSTLGRLERDGLVQVVETRSDGAAERTVYAITDVGSERLAAWLEEPEALVDRGADELVRKTVAALRTGGSELAAFVARQRAAHLSRIRELSQAPPPHDPLARMGRDHRIAHLDADLRWLDAAADRAADLGSGRPS